MSTQPRRIDLAGLRESWPLFDVATSRAIESQAAAGLPPHTLMRRAGLSAARWALAIAPHARTFRVAAGPGNNGGDGLEAAMHLQLAGKSVSVHLVGGGVRRPADAAASLERAREAGVILLDDDLPSSGADVTIDALLGLGGARAPEGALRQAIVAINGSEAPRLAIDLPSGLHAETGHRLGLDAVRATHTLALLSLKPGFVTGEGRDLIGELWFDDIGSRPWWPVVPTAWLAGIAALPGGERPHASHKGSYGDVVVVGGAPGMNGAAWLAGRAALGAGAGRVFVVPLDGAAALDPMAPELMVRPALCRDDPGLIARTTVLCGCGGGDAVRAALPLLLSRSPRLVLDADALNAVAADPSLAALLVARASHGQHTILTPHPLEAARLLGQADARSVQSDRLAAAVALAERFGAVVALKGSGTITAMVGAPPWINPTGNARLATAGTGDVLAGWVAGRWSTCSAVEGRSADALTVARQAVWEHGAAAGRVSRAGPLLAHSLIEALVAADATTVPQRST